VATLANAKLLISWSALRGNLILHTDTRTKAPRKQAMEVGSLLRLERMAMGRDRLPFIWRDGIRA
jgi:hypothetical protein